MKDKKKKRSVRGKIEQKGFIKPMKLLSPSSNLHLLDRLGWLYKQIWRYSLARSLERLSLQTTSRQFGGRMSGDAIPVVIKMTKMHLPYHPPLYLLAAETVQRDGRSVFNMSPLSYSLILFVWSHSWPWNIISLCCVLIMDLWWSAIFSQTNLSVCFVLDR